MNFSFYIKKSFLDMKIKDFVNLIQGKNARQFHAILRSNTTSAVPSSLFDKYATEDVNHLFKCIDGTGIGYINGQMCYDARRKPNNKIEASEVYDYIKLNELWDNNRKMTNEQIANMTVRQLIEDFYDDWIG